MSNFLFIDLILVRVSLTLPCFVFSTISLYPFPYGGAEFTMSQLFGPHRRNRRIRNLLLIVGVPTLILVAYFGFIKDDGNSNTDTSSETETTEETVEEEAVPEVEVVDNSPTGILTREYKWMVQSEDTQLLQELLGIAADGWYGEGTRVAHLLALEEAGLPLTGVPSIPSGCEIIIGGQLCGVTEFEDADVAIDLLTSGLGDPDELLDFNDENNWSSSTGTGEAIITIHWGALYVEFGNCYSPFRQCFKRWGIDNSFFAVRGWDKMFPGLVKLPESLLVDWDPNNPELTPLVTTTNVTGGPLIMPERWAFEENIGLEMLYDQQNDQYVMKTNLYQIIFTESSGNPPGSSEKQLRWQFFGCAETEWCQR